MRLAATPLGRRLLATATLALVLVVGVGWLARLRRPTPRGRHLPPGGQPGHRRGGWHRDRRRQPIQMAAAPVQAKRAAAPAEVRGRLVGRPPEGGRRPGPGLQQRRVSGTEIEVLVVAEAGSRMPSDYVTVRKGSSGWKVS